ncbi:MAG: DNA adenine methylase [Calditrichia bacterium]|nr:DNA adenine methylase [Calditrichia bacterium]
MTNKYFIHNYLQNFKLIQKSSTKHLEGNKTVIKYLQISKDKYPKYINEFWTSKQRQASSLHEVAYRACFKGQLPRFFINLFTNEGDVVYDPFSGRGTTVIEAALMGRNIIANDINPISKILARPRLRIPTISELVNRLSEIPVLKNTKADIDLSMFYHLQTEAELVSIKMYLKEKKENDKEDFIDDWIRMVATNRLTGHSPGFFSVYTLPPNQAVSQENQIKINRKRNQSPPCRAVKNLIIKKSKSLIKSIVLQQSKELSNIYKNSLFLTKDARETYEIPNDSIKLTVTSPPFLNVVQYAQDNWLRCWFNNIDMKKVDKQITTPHSLEEWRLIMGDVFKELYRITQKNGWVAFEVGEVRSGKVKLDESVVPLGTNAGFKCEGIVINEQQFTKTSNIWGIKNNTKGTNSNRIVILYKE